MATLNFFTRSQVKADKLVPLYARFRAGRHVNQIVKTPLFVLLEYWDGKKQMLKHAFVKTGLIAQAGEVVTDAQKRTHQVKRQAKETTDNLNITLEQLSTHVKASFYRCEGPLKKDWLKMAIHAYFYPEQPTSHSPTLMDFIEQFIQQAKTRRSHKTGRPVSYKMYREYQRTFYYLKEFARIKHRPIDFQDITLDFYHDFIQYLQSEKPTHRKTSELVIEPGLSQNTVGKKIQTLKIFLNAATDEGINTHLHFRSHRFTSIKEETQHVHLNPQEIQRLFDLDLSMNKRLEKVRDLFIVGCWTGLRFSDWSQITSQNIEPTPEGDKLLKVRQSKTGGQLYIPFHPMVSSIMDKYGGVLPTTASNQKTNQYIKEVAQMAGLNSPFEKTITKGGVTRSHVHEKWELVGTHTARRSFATNLYNAGVPSLTIMQVTGHKTESAFLGYLKVTPKEHALKLAQIWREVPEAVIRKLSVG